jgi:hypothetical protein
MTAIWPVAVTVAFTGLALLVHPVGPFGGFWRPSEICPDPTIIQLPFFAVLALTEATSFGLGFAFLAFGYPYVRSVFSKNMAVPVWLGIAWLFINWFPHNALHMNAGIDVWRTIVIDFTFHVTLIVAGCFTAYAFVSREVSNRLPSNDRAAKRPYVSLIGGRAVQGESGRRLQRLRAHVERKSGGR